jgi:hypothetical protein
MGEKSLPVIHSTDKELILDYTKSSKNQTAKEQIIQLINGKTN